MSFAANLGLGTAEGALTGGLDAALWGNNIGKGMLWGAAGGAAFTTLSSENFRNFTKGKGFYTNNKLFDKFMRSSMSCQDIIDYFGFEGKYNPDLKSKNYQSKGYWGATNNTTGKISYGNFAFENYTTLYGTYTKELFTSQKILNNLPTEKLPSDLQNLGCDTYLEEISGYIHAYKNKGLFSGNTFPWKGIEFYQFGLDLLGVKYPTYPSSFQWIYKIPRRW